MPKYIVVHTPLRHGRKGEKTSETVMPGGVIELSAKEAEAVGDNVRPGKEALSDPGEKKKPEKK
ncbi:MAG: hypothetical protein JRJ54_05840 [Deltaproteobacteria bacterium]|nr:hypothetical protein [Deltaproteobacteria bacterium]